MSLYYREVYVRLPLRMQSKKVCLKGRFLLGRTRKMSNISSMRREISKCEAEIKSNNEEIRKLEQRNFELRYNLRNTKFAVQCADDMLDYIICC